ncbi:MAG: hypothetical protein ACYCYA_00785, partial [Actinomycetes bacterium]
MKHLTGTRIARGLGAGLLTVALLPWVGVAAAHAVVSSPASAEVQSEVQTPSCTAAQSPSAIAANFTITKSGAPSNVNPMQGQGAFTTATITYVGGSTALGSCTYQFSLASYATQGPTWSSSGTQVLYVYGFSTGTISASNLSITLSVELPPTCYYQEDLYTASFSQPQTYPGDTVYDGGSAPGHGPLPRYGSTTTPYGLINWSNGTVGTCAVPTAVIVPTCQLADSPASVTVSVTNPLFVPVEVKVTVGSATPTTLPVPAADANGPGTVSVNVTGAVGASVTITYTDTSTGVVVPVGSGTITVERCVTPVAPTITQSPTCGARGSLVIPSTTGVVYTYNDTQYADGATITGPTSGTVTAAPASEGYTLAEGATTSWPVDIAGAQVCVSSYVAPPSGSFNDPCVLGTTTPTATTVESASLSATVNSGGYGNVTWRFVSGTSTSHTTVVPSATNTAGTMLTATALPAAGTEVWLQYATAATNWVDAAGPDSIVTSCPNVTTGGTIPTTTTKPVTVLGVTYHQSPVTTASLPVTGAAFPVGKALGASAALLLL